jgi:DNA-binding MarR family transcriptional regulator
MNSTDSTTTNRTAERSAYRLLSVLAAEIDRDSPLTLSLVFARVAAAGPSGIFQAAVQRELGLTSACMSRAVKSLSDVTKSKHGLGLINRSMDFARDGRAHILQLTAKGRELAQAGVTAISPAHADC